MDTLSRIVFLENHSLFLELRRLQNESLTAETWYQEHDHPISIKKNWNIIKFDLTNCHSNSYYEKIYNLLSNEVDKLSKN